MLDRIAKGLKLTEPEREHLLMLGLRGPTDKRSLACRHDCNASSMHCVGPNAIIQDTAYPASSHWPSSSKVVRHPEGPARAPGALRFGYASASRAHTGNERSLTGMEEFRLAWSPYALDAGRKIPSFGSGVPMNRSALEPRPLGGD